MFFHESILVASLSFSSSLRKVAEADYMVCLELSSQFKVSPDYHVTSGFRSQEVSLREQVCKVTSVKKIKSGLTTPLCLSVCLSVSVTVSFSVSLSPSLSPSLFLSLSSRLPACLPASHSPPPSLFTDSREKGTEQLSLNDLKLSQFQTIRVGKLSWGKFKGDC